MPIPTAKLNSGYEIPMIALGTGLPRPLNLDAVREVATQGLKAGHRHIDTAYHYTSEPAVGDAIKASGVPREEIFLTTKLPPNFLRKEHVRESFNRSLKALDVDYVDLYLIHSPRALVFVGYEHDKLLLKDENGNFFIDKDVDLLDTWRELEKIAKTGLARSIGVSNFNVEQLKYLLDNAEIPPAVNQISLHPHQQQRDVVDFCKSNNIHVTGYSPLGRQKSDTQTATMDEPLIQRLAEKYGKTPAQVLLSWGVQNGWTVATRTTNVGRVSNSLEIFTLEEEDVMVISALGNEQ